MTRKVKSFKSDTIPHQQMVMRMVTIRENTADDEAKSVQVVVASENPVERYDERRGVVVKEVLRMDGVEFRTDRRQLPIVDSHDRSTVRNVLGSVRNIRVEGTELVGEAVFASDPESQVAYRKLREGHLTDFSITATPTETQFVQRGDVAEFGSMTVEGPADVVTRWTPTDASLVAAGADETSTVRQLLRSYQQIPKETRRMLSEEMKAALVAKGMPEQIADAEQAIAWAVGVLGSAESVVEPVEMAEEMPVEEEAPAEEEVQNMEGEEKETVEMTVDRALKADRSRRREIVALCDKAGIERAFADTLCDSGTSLNVAREKVLERMISKPVGSSANADRINVTADENDKFASGMRSGLIQRSYRGAVANRPKPVDGGEQYQHMSLLRMAEKWLQRQGVNTDRMSSQDIARAALGSGSTLNRFQIRRDAYHTTGSFPNLLLDAANKSLLDAYEEAPYTWQLWARQAASTSDLKNINRIRFSESPDLEAVPEGHEYKEKPFSDQKETYEPIKYGAAFSITWETIVNDDMDAISRVPAMHGNAARRKQNKAVYSVLTDNDLMSDSVALFGSHTSGTNLSGADANPSVTTLNTAFTAMMTQTGLSSDTIVNVQPRFLIVPAALSATAEELVASRSYVIANGNEGVQNLYGQGGTRPLTVVVEPLLDANSATAWYLAADPAQIDTVELSFLTGEEAPVMESEWKIESDKWLYKVRQTFGVKAIDWRGLYKYASA